MKTYIDKATCPDGHSYSLRRKSTSAGRKVRQACPACGQQFSCIAGEITTGNTPRPTLEKHVEAYLVKRVEEIGGEVRKLKWIGRNSAPDRIVMLPEITAAQVDSFLSGPPSAILKARSSTAIWIEVKAPGKGASFPANAHERAQFREHERMRKMGQRVEVVDCYERVDEVLK